MARLSESLLGSKSNSELTIDDTKWIPLCVNLPPSSFGEDDKGPSSLLALTAAILARAQITILQLSTYEKDFVLVRSIDQDAARRLLEIELGRLASQGAGKGYQARMEELVEEHR